MKKYNFVYCTKNLINNKIYIGLHSTNNLKDGYLGSGHALGRAIDKYGRDNFIVTQRVFFDTREEAIEFEELIVDDEFILLETNYNISLGGKGGAKVGRRMAPRTKPISEKLRVHLNQLAERNRGVPRLEETKQKIRDNTDPNKYKRMSQQRKGVPRTLEDLQKQQDGMLHSEKYQNRGSKLVGKSRPPEVQEKIRDHLKRLQLVNLGREQPKATKEGQLQYQAIIKYIRANYNLSYQDAIKYYKNNKNRIDFNKLL